MTREEAKDFMWIENDKNPTIIRWQHHSTISGLVSNLIDKIFDEHEAQLREAMKPKTCEGCKYQNIDIDRCDFCKRYYSDQYELKANQ